ncbi:hypothetical protein [Collinsella vaginalis]|uniref:hypothetical protein n=1 Tax=Collinsella vaginalis TaxID=1870987 RepID=UPI000A26ED01|nr:hypothetical protein [Collinsella vaginalis]
MAKTLNFWGIMGAEARMEWLQISKFIGESASNLPSNYIYMCKSLFRELIMPQKLMILTMAAEIRGMGLNPPRGARRRRPRGVGDVVRL